MTALLFCIIPTADISLIANSWDKIDLLTRDSSDSNTKEFFQIFKK